MNTALTAGLLCSTGAAACQNCARPPLTGQGYCWHCGPRLGNEDQVNCPNCGSSMNFRSTRGVPGSGKSTTAAVILSCLWSGLGQLYLGQVWKGIVLMILYAAGFSTGFLGLILWIAYMVDAHHIGKKVLRRFVKMLKHAVQTKMIQYWRK